MPLGATEIPEEMFVEMLHDIAPRFSMRTYHVFENNCNHFTNAVAEILLGDGIPKDIINQPKDFLATPMGQMFAPMMAQAQESLMVSAHRMFDDEDLQPQPMPALGNQQQQAQMPNMGGMGGNGMGDMGGLGGMGGMQGLPPNLAQMAQNPAVQNMMRQYMGGGGMPGMGAPQPTSYPEPKHGEVTAIKSLP